MRCLDSLTAAVLVLAPCGAAIAQPDVELQSEALTPGLVLAEMERPIHQIRLIVDYDGKGSGKGTLVLDPNVPEFDAFGKHVGGLDTPYVKRKGGPLRPLELECAIAFVKESADEPGTGVWFLYRLSGPKLISTLQIATRSPILEGGPARLLVTEGGTVTTVVALTRFGLAIP